MLDFRGGVRPTRSLAAFVLLLVVSVSWPSPARADGRAAAESLFIDGRRLMDAGQYTEACQRFEDSQRLDPAVGTALNLARCYALTGRTASAWTLYREAAALASAANQREREQAALSAAAELEPTLAKLILKHEAPQPGLSVELDGSPAPDSLFLVATPVDPLEHEVVVSRKGKVLWRTKVEATAGQIVEVAIPRFAPEPPAREAPPFAPSARSERETGLTGMRRTAVIGLVATSALSLAYAAFEGLRAQSAYNESEDGCELGKCSPRALSQRELAFDRARRADAALVVAGSAALGAGVLWLTLRPAQTGTRAVAAHTPLWQISWQAAW